MLKYKYIFQIKYTEAILSNSTRKLSWFEISKLLMCGLKNKFIVLFIRIFGALSFPVTVKFKTKTKVEIWVLTPRTRPKIQELTELRRSASVLAVKFCCD